jgi:hypothetical protein
MHQERNIAESIISMCFDVTGFSEDNVNARKGSILSEAGAQNKCKGKYEKTTCSILSEAGKKKRDT